MTDINDRGDLNTVLRMVEREAEAYLGAIDTALARPPGSAEPLQLSRRTASDRSRRCRS